MKDAAYKHYLVTGTIKGMYWGDVMVGNGPPSSPMSREEYYRTVARRAKPSRMVRERAAARFGDKPDVLDGDTF